MRRSTCLRMLLVGNLALGWILAAAPSSEAVEEAWRFLDGLRAPDRGYYDMALEYLDRIEKSPHCPEDLREQIDYQRGITLVPASRLSPSLREQRLEQASAAFSKFVREHPTHPFAGDANTQLANVLVEQGRMKAELAERPSKSPDEKKQLMAQARTQYEEARKVFQAAERRVYERLKPLEEEAKTDISKVDAREEVRRDYLQARLYLAGVVHEIGKTYEPGSKEFKEHLTDAAKRYGELFATYDKFMAGLYARVQEGRVYTELGQNEKAIEILSQMLKLAGEDEAGRRLRTESLALLLETYSSPKVKKYAEALAQVDAWQDGARGAEESSPEGLEIHFLAGKAALAFAKGMKESEPQRKGYLKAARQHFEFVGRFRGQRQREAKNMLADELLGGEELAGDPTTFEEAKDLGDFAWGTMVIALGNLQSAKTAEEKKKFTAEMNESRDEALRHYHAALGMADSETSLPELNLLRFRLTYLYWIKQEFYRAAVMGEFLASRYPQSLGARQGAEIAVKAYRTLFSLSPKRPEERSFEARRMNEVAKLITTRWPTEREAAEAWMMLLDTAVDNRDLAKAQEYLAKIEPDSPRRAEAELRTGQALWAYYVQESNKPAEQRRPQQELDALATQAQQTLEQGIARMRKSVDEGGAVDYPLVYSVLSVARICVGAGQSSQAAKWLEDPKIGPLTLVAAGDPVTDKENFKVETYKAALRAYVGAQEMEKAETTMDALEAMITAGGDAAAAKRLTEIYIILGRELQETLKRLRQENKNEEAKGVTRGFELFLTRISKRGEGNTFNSLNWVAETFFNLGAAMDPGEEKIPEDVAKYYLSAAKTYLGMLDRIKNDESGEFAPPGAAANIQVRLAVCLRALHNHADAMQILLNILRERERRVDVQIEAARTYQDWASMKGECGKYEIAIKGGNKEGKRYLVWGWGGIARRVAPFDKYQDTFHEARYNLARCRKNLAECQQGTKKEDTLKMAELDITRVHTLYPTMGGEQWYQKYEALLKQIQKLRGARRPPGLPKSSD